ncbi:NAD(P)-binding protein [Leucosporidium creatinivorum]|uniref:NAD(P)-binding protein n=1 Tax=Leucosporidium creatinivorum TaxID=106004 RepID=A0A1Y2F8K8_9BASI|nr:NAD(P)-binding protein [Leucosporidium creatinivorum]
MAKIFALGATGYIGGSALHGIHAAHPAFPITALVRSEKDDEAVSKAFGDARIVHGSFSDLDLIKEEASKADFVLNGADADDLNVVKAILAGLKDRYAQDHGRKPIYLHTSGTSVIAQGKDGSFVKEAEKIFNDAHEEDIKGIPKEALHREIDLTIFAANDEGYVDAFIIAPSNIYAKGSGPVRTRSAQIPELIRVAAKRRKPTVPGPGTAIWNQVHVADLEELYVLVAKLALSGKDKNGAFGRFYFGAGEENSWGTVVEHLAPILLAKGLVDTKEIDHVTFEEEPGTSGYWRSIGTNSRSTSGRGKALGWSPREKGLVKELEGDVDATIKEYNL